MYLPDPDIKLFVLVGITVMLLLFVSVLLFFIFSQRRKYRYQQQIQLLRQQQQDDLIEAAVRSEEDERVRISEQLHDEVGALLSSSKLHLQNVTVSEDDPRNLQIYNKGQELLDDAIQKVRSISHNLHSSILQEFGLFEAIRSFLNKAVHKNVVEVSTALNCSYSTAAKKDDVIIYRMVQELINNLLKHAHPRKIHISCVGKEGQMTLTIFHNGDGLTQERFEELKFRRENMGFKIIQNRLILLKGNLLFSERPEGFYIDIQLPLAQ